MSKALLSIYQHSFARCIRFVFPCFLSQHAARLVQLAVIQHQWFCLPQSLQQRLNPHH